MKCLLALCVLEAAAAHADTCPPRATLDALAKAEWDGAAVRPRCTAIRARAPLSFVVDIATFDGKRAPRELNPELHAAIGYAAIIDEQGTVRWHQTSASQVPGDWYDWRVVDLDGDGRDEVIARHIHFGHGATSERLLLYAVDNLVDNGDARETARLPLANQVSARGFGQNSCAAAYRLVRDGRRTMVEIVGQRDSDPTLTPVFDDSCARDGKHVYRWTGQDFVEKR
jgi:hypothetical protein